MAFEKGTTRDSRNGRDAGASRHEKFNQGRAGKSGHQKIARDVEQDCCDMYPDCECPRIK